MVSIIIITFNRYKLLTETLKSIINQSVIDFEILIIDDGSNDNTYDTVMLLGDNRIRYFNFGRIGNLSKLRNIGIRNSKYDLIAFCDDDDLWYPDKLKRQIEFMNEYDFVCSNATVIDGAGNEIKKKYFDEIDCSFVIDLKYLLSKGNNVLTSSCLLKRKLFIDHGEYFDESYFTNYCEDYELFIRLARHSQIYFINENLILKRSHLSVSGGLENNLKMLDTSVEILSAYRIKNNNNDDLLPIEGILGFKILTVKYALKANFSSGIKEFMGLLRYLACKNVFKVFINKKLRPKLKKIFSFCF